MAEWPGAGENCQKKLFIPVPVVFHSVKMSQRTTLILVFLSGMVAALIATLLPNFNLWFLHDNKRQITASRPGIQSVSHIALTLPFSIRRKSDDSGGSSPNTGNLIVFGAK